MQRVAYGILKLQPHQFWSLTIREYRLMIEGAEMVDEGVWRKMAQMASWVTAPHLKKPINPEKLLEKPNKEKQKTTPEYTKQFLEELEDEFQN